MKPISLLLVLALASLFACSFDEPEIPVPPSEWIVVGNDLGLRNEFLDMANVIRLRDSSMTVYPLGSPNVALDYPIVDSILHGGDERWRMIPHNLDTIIFFDSLKNNSYYLHRLVDRDSLESSLVVGRDFFLGSSRRGTSYLFEDTPGTELNCYLSRGYFEYDNLKRVAFGKDGYWRIDHRFRQPLLMITTGNVQHTVILIDSASVETGLSGVAVNNNMPNGRERRQRFVPSEKSFDYKNLADMLDRIDTEKTRAKLYSNPDSLTRYTRFTTSGRELKEWRSMNDFEATNLQLSITGDRYRLHTSEQELFEGEIALHPTGPYLLIDGGCADQNYLPIHASATDTLVITVPVRMIITTPMEMPTVTRNGVEVTMSNGQHFINNEVVLHIPTIPGM
jgi:hypothetical protein